MTDPNVDTLQYRCFLRQLNKALPLELAIRAARLACPGKLEELRGIDAAIRTAWEERGFTKGEVVHNGLAELCWDLTQLGWSERRSPFERWGPDALKMIEDGVGPICEIYLRQVKLEDYPFARRHRYADLVHGMDVDRVLREYAEKYSKLKIAPDDGGIPISNFVLSLRAPVPVVPGALQQIRHQGPHQSEYLGLMLRYDMPLEDVRAALLDFQYHYAEFRLRDHGLSDDTAHRLLDPWGNPPMPSKDDLINQAHQVHPSLAGLHSYDRFVANNGGTTRGARARALAETIALHPKSVAPEKSRAGKWLDSTRSKIEKLAEGFGSP
jgi:hypothetical protein